MQMSDDDIQRAWREEKACDDLEFMFQMKQSGRELAAGIAENSLRCAPVSGSNYWVGFDPALTLAHRSTCSATGTCGTI